LLLHSGAMVPKMLAVQLLALLPVIYAFTSPPLVARSFTGASLPSRRSAAASVDPESGSSHVTPGDKQAKLVCFKDYGEFS